MLALTLSILLLIISQVTILCSLKSSRRLQELFGGSWSLSQNLRERVSSCSISCSKLLNGKTILDGSQRVLKLSPISFSVISSIHFWSGGRSSICVFTVWWLATLLWLLIYIVLALPVSRIIVTQQMLRTSKTTMFTWLMLLFKKLLKTMTKDLEVNGI